MVETEQITELAQRIARDYHPERIILFGSYARGTPSSDSDVDLLVILPFEGNPIRKAAEILTWVNPQFPVDLLARTPEQVRQRLDWNDFFLREVITEGKVLYEAAHSGMGRQGGE
jgi:predicted nucleotidyltransferase